MSTLELARRIYLNSSRVLRLADFSILEHICNILLCCNQTEINSVMDSKANLLKDFQLLRLRSLSSLSIFILLGLFCDLGVVFRVVKFMVVNFILYFFFLSISYYILLNKSMELMNLQLGSNKSIFTLQVKCQVSPYS